VARSALLRLSRLSLLRCFLKNALPFTINVPKFSYKIPPSFIFLKSYKIISKSGMRLEVLMGNKISEKFVLTNEGIINIKTPKKD
jgi:hypothetical protein